MRHQHDRRVELDERLLEPLQRLDVEMVGGLVQQQQVRARGERTRERRARELAAREGIERAVQLGVVRSRVRAPSRWRGRAKDSHRAPRAAPERAHSARASASSWRAGPHLPPARPARPRSAAPRCSRTARSRAERDRDRAADAGRAAPAPPFATDRAPIDRLSPASIRNSVVLPAPLRPASVIRSRRSSLNETPRSSGCPAMSLCRSEAIITAIGRDSRARGCRRPERHSRWRTAGLR